MCGSTLKFIVQNLHMKHMTLLSISRLHWDHSKMYRPIRAMLIRATIKNGINRLNLRRHAPMKSKVALTMVKTSKASFNFIVNVA